jgi:hypothetical protein
VEQVPKYRNMFLQVVLFIITFGIYGLYWFYQTTSEMAELTGDTEVSPGLLTVLLVIPIVNIYSMYQHSELCDKMTAGRMPVWALLILWIIFTPAAWIIVQLELNKRADEALKARVYAT